MTEDNKVYTFGGGEHGQLGHGDKVRPTHPLPLVEEEFGSLIDVGWGVQVNKTSPYLVADLVGKGCVQVTCGWSHTVALTEDGKVRQTPA